MDTILQDTPAVGPARPVVKRRQHSKALKRQLVKESFSGKDSVSVIARRHDINANLLFKWRRQYERGEFGSEPDSAALVPIVVSQPGVALPPDSVQPGPELATGSLDIYLAGGHRLTLAGAVCPIALRTVLEVLSV